MERPIGTTILEALSVVVQDDTNQIVQSSRKSSTTFGKKRKRDKFLKVDGEDEEIPAATPRYLAIWKHRIQLKMDRNSLDRFLDRLRDHSPCDAAVTYTPVNSYWGQKLNHLELAVSSVADAEHLNLFKCEVKVDQEASNIFRLLHKIEGTKKARDQTTICWKIWPLILASHESSAMLEFTVKRIDTHEINWQTDKWLAKFIATTMEHSNQTTDMSQLPAILATSNISAKASIRPQDFYTSVHVPDPDIIVPDMVQVSELTSQMFPFQRRTVQWMMAREAVSMEDGHIKTTAESNELDSLCLQDAVDYDGQRCYLSIPLSITTTNLDGLKALARSFRVKGGILAEEMGLGKTVELISLLALHRREISGNQPIVFDEYSKSFVRISGSTLIICPPSIIQQWASELSLHAPALRVLKYTGTRDLVQIVHCKRNGKKFKPSTSKYNELSLEMQDIPNAELVDYLLEFDIVLSSYNVLASELHYAEKPPDRSMRREKKYERRSCPLVEISWWRVCLDEAQMIENGISNAAQVARLIPRVNAWAVSGTPVQKTIEDLYGLLIFLRQEPWCGPKQLWESLNSRKEWFSGLFGKLALRHTKNIVHDEIKLPKQNRTAISLGFSQIEEENYQKVFEQACKEIGVHPDGSPLNGDWNPESEDVRSRMRTWLVRLRQTCVHPQVGAWNRKALGGGSGSGEMRTVDEVLDVMIQQNITGVKQDQRMMFLLMASRAQISLEVDKDFEQTVTLLSNALEPLHAAIDECRIDIKQEPERRKKIIAGEHSTTRVHKDQRNKDGAIERQVVEDEYIPDEEQVKENWEESADELEGGISGRATRQESEINKLRNRLRDILEVEHIYYFYLGSAYYNMRENAEEKGLSEDEVAKLTDLENSHYESAKKIRKELMTESENKVERYLSTIEKKTEKQDFVEIPELVIPKQKGGIESSNILDEMEQLSEKLNEQADLLDEWREALIQIVQAPLIDQDDDAKGDELEMSAQQQDEGHTYVALIRAVIADREEAVLGLTSELARVQMRTAKQLIDLEDAKHIELFQDLSAKRDDVRPINVDSNVDSGVTAMEFSLRGLVAKLKRLANPNKTDFRSKAEAGLVEQVMKKLQPAVVEQEKALEKLSKEIDFLGDTYNSRLEFYRQLQNISDMVQPFDKEKSLKANSVKKVDELAHKYLSQELKLRDRVAQGKAKGRFLLHLKESSGESQRMCIICQDAVVVGYLTVCGHQFCKECMEAWYREHHTCPVCKRKLQRVDLHPVTYKPEEITIQKEGQHQTGDASLSQPSESHLIPTLQIYTGINDYTFKQIKNINLRRSFGSKIDMIVRHLLWIRRYDSGAKSVIFSQWKEVLDVFQKALSENEIGFSSLEEKKGLEKFKNDPKVEVFLLHAKSQSAGLTLVSASNVFLTEPLVNTGLELQAIARVHRIGQQRETNVFLYCISNTVEESVYKNATKRRMEMLQTDDTTVRPIKKARLSGGGGVGNGTAISVKGKHKASSQNKTAHDSEDLEMQLETANSLHLQEGTISTLVEKRQGGGEIVRDGELWSCLFEVTWRDRAVEIGETRRHIFADAAERRMMDSGSGVGDRRMEISGRVRDGEVGDEGEGSSSGSSRKRRH